MPLAGKKRLLWTLAAAVFLAAVFLLALPFVASTRIVSNRIAAELSAMTGFRVELGEPPEIDVWPSFEARLHRVTMMPLAGNPETPRLDAEEIAASLDAWSALRGDVRFRTLALIRPVLTFPTVDAATLALPPAARVSRAVKQARDIYSQAGDRTSSRLPDEAALGTISIENGRIDFADRPAGSVTSIDATLAWPRLLQVLRLSGTAIWHGEPVEFSFKAADGLALLSGQRSKAEINLSSKLVSLQFDGSLEASSPPLAEGQAHLASPAMKKALEWIGTSPTLLAPEGDFSLDAALTGAAGRAKLDDVRLTLEGQGGTGVIEIGLDPPERAITGTLAFGSLDLTPLVPAATAPTLMAAGGMPAVESGVAGPFAVDLRLSADTARLGPFTLAKVAATLNARAGLTAFDLSDAAALGGTVRAGFRATLNDGLAEISLRGVDIDAGLLAEAAGMTARQPTGKATINAMIKGPDADWRRLIEHGSGTVSIKLTGGAIADIDRAEFVARAKAGGFFGLGEFAGGSLGVEEAEIRATLERGIARIDKCEIRSPETVVTISGVVPLPDKGLALSGMMRATGEGDEAPLFFFVGGSMTSPYFYSMTNSTSGR